MPDRRAFTLIELIAVIVVLAVLAGVAIPVYFDWGDEAREAADEGSIGGIRTALNKAYLQHRIDDAPSSEWIAQVDQIALHMATGELPTGIVIDTSGAEDVLVDQRGWVWELTPETNTSPALLNGTPPGGGGGGGGGGALLGPEAALIALLLVSGRRRRRYT